MRIDTKTTTVSPVTSVKHTSAAAPVSTAAHDKGAASVVELSKAGAAASSARVDASSGASPEKLDRLRALIEKGDYHPDLDLLAKRIVHDELLGDAG